MKRCLVIYHPAFDAPGKDGVNAALEMANTMKAGNKVIVAQAKETGASPEEIQQMAETLSQYQYFIRKVDV